MSLSLVEMALGNWKQQGGAIPFSEFVRLVGFHISALEQLALTSFKTHGNNDEHLARAGVIGHRLEELHTMVQSGVLAKRTRKEQQDVSVQFCARASAP